MVWTRVIVNECGNFCSSVKLPQRKTITVSCRRLWVRDSSKAETIQLFQISIMFQISCAEQVIDCSNRLCRHRRTMYSTENLTEFVQFIFGESQDFTGNGNDRIGILMENGWIDLNLGEVSGNAFYVSQNLYAKSPASVRTKIDNRHNSSISCSCICPAHKDFVAKRRDSNALE